MYPGPLIHFTSAGASSCSNMLQLLLLLFIASTFATEHKMKSGKKKTPQVTATSLPILMKGFFSELYAILDDIFPSSLIDNIFFYMDGRLHGLFCEKDEVVGFRDVAIDKEKNLLVGVTADFSRVSIYSLFNLITPLKSISISPMSKCGSNYVGLTYNNGRLILLFNRFFLVFSREAMDPRDLTVAPYHLICQTDVNDFTERDMSGL